MASAGFLFFRLPPCVPRADPEKPRQIHPVDLVHPPAAFQKAVVGGIDEIRQRQAVAAGASVFAAFVGNSSRMLVVCVCTAMSARAMAVPSAARPIRRVNIFVSILFGLFFGLLSEMAGLFSGCCIFFGFFFMCLCRMVSRGLPNADSATRRCGQILVVWSCSRRLSTAILSMMVFTTVSISEPSV